MQLHIDIALKRMHEQTNAGVPFKISYYTYSEEACTGGECRTIDKVLLRKGLREDKSMKAPTLVSYTDLKTNQPRQFNICLLISLNNIPIYL